ncbi:3-deoxy-D-manno-octulosonic acid kinase [Ningiella sp. W23]|uniref:3-deoxy-D-manno-octulosonic acid kinase n=1 Tax=Ningiella sp. W23 TaxID=3023715 RepID=UPI003757EBB7
MTIDVHTAPNNVSLLRTELGKSLNIGLKHFELDYLHGKNAITRTAHGRGEVYFFTQLSQPLVLRHYYRGGLFGKFNRDRFLHFSIQQSRGFKELDILSFLASKGLNVPSPVAARVIRKGLFYRADIITAEVSKAQELHQVLMQREIADSMWEAIGKIIAQLHQLHVRHDDINVKNVLIQEDNRVALIDFDKCYRDSTGNWHSANLARFYRSLLKQQRAQATKKAKYHFALSNWESLQTGYASLLSD